MKDLLACTPSMNEAAKNHGEYPAGLNSNNCFALGLGVYTPREPELQKRQFLNDWITVLNTFVHDADEADWDKEILIYKLKKDLQEDWTKQKETQGIGGIGLLQICPFLQGGNGMRCFRWKKGQFQMFLGLYLVWDWAERYRWAQRWSTIEGSFLYNSKGNWPEWNVASRDGTKYCGIVGILELDNREGKDCKDNNTNPDPKMVAILIRMNGRWALICRNRVYAELRSETIWNKVGAYSTNWWYSCIAEKTDGKLSERLLGIEYVDLL